MRLNNRLKQLEKLAAAKRQQLKEQHEREQQAAAIARFETMPTEQLLAEYHAALNEPLTAELAAKLETMDVNELIKFYFEIISHD